MRGYCNYFQYAAVLVLCVAGLGSGSSAVVQPRESLGLALQSNSVCADPPELLQPKPKRVAKTPWHYGGKVLAVGPDWVELGPGWKGSVEVDRFGRKTIRENGDTKKPKRISAAGTTPGGNAKGEGDRETHHITDLTIGDVVSISSWEGADGSEWVTRVWIERRPGGKIPPMRGEVLFPGEQPSNHLQNQAEQDWEEKGTPIPKKYLDRNGRAPWTNPPYPPEAPAPHDAKPKP